MESVKGEGELHKAYIMKNREHQAFRYVDVIKV
jgi:hypothetical protein